MTLEFLGDLGDGSPAWHEARKGRIGGSDIGAVVGLSPYTTRAELLAEKRGEAERKPSTAAMRRGHYAENYLRAYIEGEHGIVDDRSRYGTYVDGWQHCNPDGISTEGVLIEHKSTRARSSKYGWGRGGTNRIPAHYLTQVTWCCGMLGLDRWVMPVLSTKIGTDRDNQMCAELDLAMYKGKFDPAYYQQLKMDGFWFVQEMQGVAA